MKRHDHRSAFEPLESRKLLAVDVSVSTLITDANTLQATVLYTGDVNQATIGNGDLVLRGPAGFADTAATLKSPPVMVSLNTVRAVYQFAAPQGAWGWSDTGAYRIVSPAG